MTDIVTSQTITHDIVNLAGQPPVWGGISGLLGNQGDLVAAFAGKEPAAGNPPVSGYVWSSTAAGVRSWIPQSGGGGGAGYTDLTIGAPVALPAPGHVQFYSDYLPSYISQVPNMTSNTTPSGVVSASSFLAGGEPWRAFDTASFGWLSTTNALPAWIQYQFPTAKTIKQYKIRPWDVDTFPSRSPTAWVLRGSNDSGLTWTDLDTRTVLSASWSSGQLTPFLVATPGSYLIYRLYITANGGDMYTGVHFIELDSAVVSSVPGLFMRDSSGVIKTVALT